MDRKQALEMAIEAGFSVTNALNTVVCDKDAIERFAALVAAHEREQCALVCDAMGNPWRGSEDCAAAIRSRSELSQFIPD